MKTNSKERSNTEQMCLQAVQHFRKLPGFQLFEENEYLELMLDRCRDEKSKDSELIFQNMALNIYSEGLYQAVTSLDNPSVQEKGFTELSKYLYRMAYNFYLNQSKLKEAADERGQEATQTALERIYRNLNKIISPGGFLKWCTVILRNTCLEDVRKSRLELELDDEKNQGMTGGEEHTSLLEIDDARDCLKLAVLRLPKEYQSIIQLSYFSPSENGGKLKDEEIAVKLNIKIGNLYTMRSRALSTLRKDKKLLECMQINL